MDDVRISMGYTSSTTPNGDTRSDGCGVVSTKPVDVDPNILQRAMEACLGDRQKNYGTPYANHTRTARLWSVYLNMVITPEQVCFLNLLQKIARAMHSITDDTLVDIAGYALNVELVQKDSAKFVG